MNFKELFKTKTAWLGLALVGYGFYHILMLDMQDQGLDYIKEGLILIFGRHAISKINKRSIYP